MKETDAGRELLDRVTLIFDGRVADLRRSERRLVVISDGGQCPLDLEVQAGYAVLTLGAEGECVLERGLHWSGDILSAAQSVADHGDVSSMTERLGALRPGYRPYERRDGRSHRE